MYKSMWKIFIWDLFWTTECNKVVQISSESLMVLHTLIDDDVDDDDVCEEAGDECDQEKEEDISGVVSGEHSPHSSVSQWTLSTPQHYTVITACTVNISLNNESVLCNMKLLK